MEIKKAGEILAQRKGRQRQINKEIHMDLRYLVIIGNEFLNKRVTHDLVRVVADQFHCTLIPDIYSALCVDTEDGGVSGINQFRVLAFLCDTSSNILPDAHHANHIALLVSSRRGVKKDLNSNAILGDEGKLEVSRLFATHGFVQNGLHSAAIFFRDKFL